jgi:hypothetical protein
MVELSWSFWLEEGSLLDATPCQPFNLDWISCRVKASKYFFHSRTAQRLATAPAVAKSKNTVNSTSLSAA